MRITHFVFAAIYLTVFGSPQISFSVEPSAEQLELLKTFRDEFVRLTPGKENFPAEFTMGSADGDRSEQPAHVVKILRPFSIARFEVPQNLWQAVMGENPSKWKGNRNSVEMLSFDDAEKFCAAATDLMRTAGLIRATETIRLPSEAEWEYATRAGTKTRYSFGDDVRDLDEHAWHTGNAAGNDPAVGAKRGNAWKLHDTHGYLWEWCADPWHANYEGAPTDGSVWTKDGDPKQRVLRSGSWKDKPDRLTSTARRSGDVDLKDDAVGLRCVLAE